MGPAISVLKASQRFWCITKSRTDLADARNLLALDINHWGLGTLALVWAASIEARGLGESGSANGQTAGLATNIIASNGFENTDGKLLIVFTELDSVKKFVNGLIFTFLKMRKRQVTPFDGASSSARIWTEVSYQPTTFTPYSTIYQAKRKKKIIKGVFQMYSGRKRQYSFISQTNK